jgi:tetratricopeptide (TPR) repeat protein
MCDELLAKRRNDVNLLALRAHVATNRMEYDEAIRLFERCVSLQPRDLGLQLELARTPRGWASTSRRSRALKKHRSSGAAIPRSSAVWPMPLNIQASRTRPVRCWNRGSNAGTEDALMAMVWGRVCLSQKAPQDAVAILVRHSTDATVPRAFFHTLGQAHERADNLEEAFAAYRRANESPNATFDLHEFTERHRTLMKAFSRKALAALPRPMHATEKAVFIAGRPRSGTTLVETILDSHPDITGVGELPDLMILTRTIGLEIGSTLPYPRCITNLDQDDVNRLSSGYMKRINQVAPKAIRTVDKNLQNFVLGGLIQALLPQARIIHIRRDPIDNCWATFVADMSTAWMGSLQTQGIAYAFYERLMRHWHEVLDVPILDVEYEALVDDQENWTRRLGRVLRLAVG